MSSQDLAHEDAPVDPRWITVKGVRRWNGDPFPEPSESTLRRIALERRPGKRPHGNACLETAGTYAGFMRHRRALQDPCEPCAEASRQYSIAAAKRRVDEGVKPCPGCGEQIHYRSKSCRPCFYASKLKPCGTRAAYRRHLRKKEVPCELCRAAERHYQRAWNIEREAA